MHFVKNKKINNEFLENNTIMENKKEPQQDNRFKEYIDKNFDSFMTELKNMNNELVELRRRQDDADTERKSAKKSNEKNNGLIEFRKRKNIVFDALGFTPDWSDSNCLIKKVDAGNIAEIVKLVNAGFCPSSDVGK